MRLDPGQIEVMDDCMAEVLRAKTGAGRLRIADGMFRFVRQLIEASVRQRNPEWDERRIQREVARRISRGAIDS